ncbi:MAG: hypothetical protein Q8Q90_00505 [bacterium]|nr:hypothetical protein [bacterium]
MENNLENKFESEEEKTSRAVKMRDELYERNYVVLQDAIVDYAEDIQAKHSDYLEYIFYHMLIGSTPKYKLSKLDFEGEDSVMNFLEKQIQELPPKNK